MLFRALFGWQRMSADSFIGLHHITERDIRDPPASAFPLAQPRLVNSLGHLSPNGSLANLAALYPFNRLADLHRHFKLAIILGLSDCCEAGSAPVHAWIGEFLLILPTMSAMQRLPLLLPQYLLEYLLALP
jgi:hypothetical protein